MWSCLFTSFEYYELVTDSCHSDGLINYRNESLWKCHCHGLESLILLRCLTHYCMILWKYCLILSEWWEKWDIFLKWYLKFFVKNWNCVCDKWSKAMVYLWIFTYKIKKKKKFLPLTTDSHFYVSLKRSMQYLI